MTLQQRLTLIDRRIAEACTRRRMTGDVTLVAVTKTVPIDAVREALALGLRHIGESRIQEASVKFSELADSLAGVTKHLIGHLQTNKAKKAVELFDLIQSIDSVRLAEEVNKQAAQIHKVQNCLVEIKVSSEETKYGVRPADAAEIISQISGLKNIRVCGLICMAPYFDDPQQARPYFRRARELFDGINAQQQYPELTILSMGMSNDFEVAIEEGATMIRVGSALFSEGE